MAWAEVMVSWLPSTEKFSPVVLLEKGVVTQLTVGIRESEGILLAVPFQLIGPGVGGAAEKLGSIVWRLTALSMRNTG